MTEWIAYSRLEPWGEERADWRMAVLAALIANQWRGKDSTPVSPEDFMPDFLGEREARREGRTMDLAETIAWARQQSGG